MSDVGTGKTPGQTSVTSSCIAVRKTELGEMEYIDEVRSRLVPGNGNFSMKCSPKIVERYPHIQ